MNTYARTRNNLLPFIVLLGSLAVIIGFYFLFQLFFGTDEGMVRKANLEVNKPSKAEVFLSGSFNGNEVSNVSLQEGESVFAKKGSDIKVVFFENSQILLDEDARIKLHKMREFSDGASYLEIELEKGRAWIKVPRKVNPRSKFIIFNSESNVYTETTDALFSYSGNQVDMIEGNKILVTVPAPSKNMNDFFLTLGVGQSVSFLDADLLSLKNGGAGPAITMITEEFRQSPWFALSELLTKKPEADVALDFDVVEEEDIDLDSEEDEEEEVDESISEAVGEIKITAPNNGDDYETDLAEVIVSGTVTANATKVVVNDYTLGLFKAGDLTWSYKIRESFGNRKSQEFTVEAFDKDGKLIGEDSIYITFQKEGNTETSAESDDEQVTTVNSGDFKITAPSADDEYETFDRELLIEGSAPTNTAKVVVAGFTLTQFKKGDTTWNYRVAERLGNAGEPGDSIVYQATAYDDDDKVIGNASIKIIFKSTVTSGEVAR